MEKYGDIQDKDEHVEITGGPFAGRNGIIKEANKDRVKVALQTGQQVWIEEALLRLK